MNLRRFLGSMLATALAATTLGVVATASPAAAATATKIVPSSGSSWISYSSKTQPGAPVNGSTIYFYLDVDTTDGSTAPYAGTMKVQRKLAGSSKWTTVATSTGAYLYDSTKAVANATYRASYSGGSSGENVWSPSSADKSIKVQRKIDFKNVGNKKVVLSGKVAPKYKGKVAIFKKNGKKWKKFKTVRTNKKSKFRTSLPAPRNGKYFWNVKISGSKKFAPSQTGKFYTYSY